MKKNKIILGDVTKIKINISHACDIFGCFKIKDRNTYCSLIKENEIFFILIEDYNETEDRLNSSIKINATNREDAGDRFFALSEVFDVENNEINIF